MSNRKEYDEELRVLSSQLVNMSVKAMEAVSNAVLALRVRDLELARTVVAGDETVDHLERELEQQCMKLLLMQQPVAADLRQVGATMKMITDIERIGDEAVNIAELVLYQKGDPIPEMVKEISAMAEKACAVVDGAVTAYVAGDLELARKTAKDDDEVDEMFADLRTRLGKHLCGNPDEMDEVLDDLMIIKYLERVADHGVNLCEWVEFRLTGIHKAKWMFG